MLKVLARGSAMVFDHLSPRHRYVGREWDASLASDGVAGGWRPLAEPSEVPADPEFVRALRDGSLWAADAATAKRAGVAFDPKYGGEYAAKPAKPAEEK